MKTTTHCSPHTFIQKWRAGLRRSLKSVTTLFLFSTLFFASKTFAQLGTAPVLTPTGGFAIDGNLGANITVPGVGDWVPGSAGSGGYVLDGTNAGNPLVAATTFHVVDLYNSGSDDNFSGSNKKFNDNPNLWQWTNNPVGAKVDINNALVHFSKDANNHLWAMVAADRRSDNGSAYMDFEFLQNTLTVNPNGTFSSAGPNGGRTLNDFVLTLELTSGGSTATFYVWRWKQISPGVFDYVQVPFPVGSTYAAVNPSDGTPVSFNAFGGHTYSKNTFAEAAVDLTALIGSFDPCLQLGIKSLFIKTKVSASDDATIVDFITPSLSVDLTIGVANAGVDQSKCSEGDLTNFALVGTATPPPGDNVVSTTWSIINGTGTIHNGSTLTPDVDVTSASATLRLTVVTESGCTPAVFDDVILSVVSSPTVFDLSSTGFCAGSPVGGTVTLSNSDGGISYQLKDGSNNDVQSPKPGVTGSALIWTDIPAGTYHVVATATGGCNSETGETTVSENALPNAPTTADASRCGPGSVELTASGCEGGTLIWYDGDGNVVQTGSTFDVSVNETTSFFVSCSNGGCESERVEAKAIINEEPSADAVATDASCNGSSNGSVDLTVTGGKTDYSFAWSNGATTEDLTGLAADSYSVTVTDANSCTATASATVHQPDAISASTSVTGVRCNGESNGSVDLTVSGGTAGYTFAWTKTGDGSFSASGEDLTNVSAGTYHVVITDQHSCTKTADATVGQPAVLSCSAVQNSTRGCSTTVNDGAATVTASGGNGGYSYAWDDGETNATATSLSAGSHSVTVTDSKGCTTSCSVTIGQRVCTGIYPTSTSCAGYNSGTIQFLAKVCVTTQKKKGSTSTTVSNATPGVFFYYTKITAPSAAFDVYVDETQCSSLNKPFLIASGQILAYKDNCTKLGSGTTMTNGDGVIHITKATAGQPVVIGVKYDVKSIVGATVTGSLPCTANFVVRSGTTNAAPVIAGTSTSILIASNCSAAMVATTLETNDELKVTASPNPYTSSVNFRFTSPVSGKAILEAYDLVGKKLAIIYEGNVDAGVERVVKYNVSAANKVTMVYKLTVGDKTSHGMLIPQK